MIDYINTWGNYNIIFAKNETIETDKMFNLVFGGDGMYFYQNTKWGSTLHKISNIPYQNINLYNLKVDRAINCNIPKAPHSMIKYILECFKYVQDKTKAELMFNIYWDTKTKKHVLDLVDNQIVGAASINYELNEKFEMSDRYIKYLQIHSHHSMGASFSSVDDKDESSNTLCYYGVLGNLNKGSTIFNMGNKFRVWSGLSFIMIDIEQVFDMPKTTKLQINKCDINKLNVILDASKKKESTCTKHYINHRKSVFKFPELDGTDDYEKVWRDYE